MQTAVTSFGDLPLCHLVSSFLYSRLQRLCLELVLEKGYVPKVRSTQIRHATDLGYHKITGKIVYQTKQSSNENKTIALSGNEVFFVM